jgi:hypothetical protein
MCVCVSIHMHSTLIYKLYHGMIVWLSVCSDDVEETRNHTASGQTTFPVHKMQIIRNSRIPEADLVSAEQLVESHIISCAQPARR